MKPLLYKLHEYSTDLEQIGENLALEYSSNKKFDKFYVLGNSYQETREGYNSLNIEDVRRGDNCTIDNKTDTSFRVTVTDNTQEALIFIKANLLQGNHTVQMNRISQTSNLTSALQLYTSSLTWIKEILPNEKSKATFNISSSEASVDDTYYIRVWLKVNNSTEDIQSVILSNLMIYEGTDDKPYEQYGETPSEKYPSKIKSCGDNGNINFKICNNLYNRDYNATTIIKYGSNGFTLKRNENRVTRVYLKKALLPGQYTFCFKTINSVGLTNDTDFHLTFKEIETINILDISLFKKNVQTITLDKECKELYFYLDGKLGNDAEITIDEIQILKGTYTEKNIPKFEKYDEQNILIPIQKPFRAVNENKDTFIFENGKWYEQHKIKRIESYNNEEINTEYMSSTGGLDVGATVDYVLTEPEEIECNEEQTKILNSLVDLHTYKVITHIQSEDEVSPVFEVEYSKDLETILKNN